MMLPNDSAPAESDSSAGAQSADAPERESRSASTRGAGPAAVVALVLFLLLPVFYVLSIGPVVWLFSTGRMEARTAAALQKFYYPLEFFHDQAPTLAAPVEWYAELWRVESPPVTLQSYPPSSPIANPTPAIPSAPTSDAPATGND